MVFYSCLPLHDVLWDYNLFLRVAPAEMSLPFHNGMSYKSHQLLHEGWLCLAILLGSNGCGLISNPPPENIIQIIIIIIRWNTYLGTSLKKNFLHHFLKLSWYYLYFWILYFYEKLISEMQLSSCQKHNSCIRNFWNYIKDM